VSYRFGKSFAENPFTGKPIGLYAAQVGNHVDFWVWEGGVCIKRLQTDMMTSDIPIQVGIGMKPPEEYESANKDALRGALKILALRWQSLSKDKLKIERFLNEHSS
jgi:hypothetical protein